MGLTVTAPRRTDPEPGKTGHEGIRLMAGPEAATTPAEASNIGAYEPPVGWLIGPSHKLSAGGTNEKKWFHSFRSFSSHRYLCHRFGLNYFCDYIKRGRGLTIELD